MMQKKQEAFSQLIESVHNQLAAFQSHHMTMVCSSSFQTQSVPLLHILSQYDKNIEVVFLDTGFLFPETIAFRQTLVDTFGLTVRIERSDIPHSQQMDASGLFYYNSDTDYCCHLNKVIPMDRVLKEYDVWINGVRADQSKVRANFEPVMETDKGIVRYHPMLYWTSKMIYDYIHAFDLPKHPLHDAGYKSIGCVPCTISWVDELGRDGRWQGQSKTECGLHTDLA